MGRLRKVGIGILAASLGGYGCSASTSAPGGGAGGGDDALGDDSAVDPGTEAGPTEDAAPPLEYPAGPYGKTVGAVMPNLSWQGYRDGTGEWTTISLLDYYDPDGSRGIHAIKLGAAALW
jgi:hypothetical protein